METAEKEVVRGDDLYEEILKAGNCVSGLILRSAKKESDLVRFCLQDACSALSRAAWLRYNRPFPVEGRPVDHTEKRESMTKEQAEVYVELLSEDLKGIASVRLDFSKGDSWAVDVSLGVDNRNGDFGETIILETEEGASKFLTGLRLGLSKGERPV